MLAASRVLLHFVAFKPASIIFDGQFQAREINRGFVQMQYFGNLRRNPNDPPDGNFNGFNFWLNKLSSSTATTCRLRW